MRRGVLHRSLLVISLLLMWTASAAAQSPGIETCPKYDETIKKIVDARTSAEVKTQAEALFNLDRAPRCFSVFAAGNRLNADALQELVKRLESLRPDKQSGTAGAASGSTSVVSQGPVTRALSFAAERGALARSVNGQLITIRGNLAGIPSLIGGDNIFPYCPQGIKPTGYCLDRSLINLLRRITIAASIDATAAGQTLSVTPAAPSPSVGPAQVSVNSGGGDLRALSVRIELRNKRDVSSAEFKKEFQEKIPGAIARAAEDLVNTTAKLVETITNQAGYQAWFNRSVKRVTDRPTPIRREDVVAALTTALNDLIDTIVRPAIPDYQQQAAVGLDAYNRFFLEQDDLIDSLSTKPVVALEVTNSRPAGQPQLNTVRLIWDRPLTERSKFSMNWAVDFYRAVPVDARADVKTFRDAQFGLQYDRSLFRNSLSAPVTWSVGAYYQYQSAPAVLTVDPASPIPGVTFTGLPASAQTVFTRTGHIVLGQAKVTIVPQKSAIKIPVAFTYSNRTELIDKQRWGFQFGVAYDFDSLVSLLKGKS